MQNKHEATRLLEPLAMSPQTRNGGCMVHTPSEDALGHNGTKGHNIALRRNMEA